MSTNGASASPASKSTRSASQNKDVTTSSAVSSSTSAKLNTPSNSQYFRDIFSSVVRSGTSANNGNRSPISPPRITRLHEKEEMQNLNDRLVIYIDTVRRLEQENQRLQTVVQSYNDNSTRDVSEIKVLYERELEDAKRLIDELAKDKAKFEIALNKTTADAEEALSKLEKREKEFKTLEAKLKASESESLEYKGRYEELQRDNARKLEELNKLKPSHAELEKQLAKLRKQLEEETLLRVDLENKNQTLKEDLIFKSQIYDKEVDQLRSSKRVEIEQVDVRLRDEYDSRLVSELQRIRDETEYKINEMKDDVERRYQNKLSDADSQVKRLTQSNNSLKEDVTSSRTRVEELLSEIKQSQTKLQANETRIKELEDRLRKAAAKYDKDILDKDNELITARKELQETLLEYQELHDIKINLDMEIAAYRKLLESEEQRLNISSMSTHHSQLGASYLHETSISQTTSTKTKKRKMNDDASLAPVPVEYVQTQQSSCGIEIADHDFEGKCIKIINNTDKELPIGQWILRRAVDNGETVEHKFSSRQMIKAGQQISIWSANSGVTQELPNDIVMQKNWPVGDSMATLLVDKEGNEQSRRDSRKIQSTIVEKKLRSTPTRSATEVKTTEIKISTESTSTTNGSERSSVSKIFSFFK